jgi:hypothetical protein
MTWDFAGSLSPGWETALQGGVFLLGRLQHE